MWESSEQLISLSFHEESINKGVRPRIDACSATNPTAFRNAALHGLWYVTVHKHGGIHEASNYTPWLEYQPKKEWLVSLWAQHKLTHDQYECLSARFRIGHAARMADLAAVRRTERALAVKSHVQGEAEASIQADCREFNVYPEVEEFIGFFAAGVHMLRRPILVIIGATNLGKSMLAADILNRVARHLDLREFLEITVEDDDHLDLSDFEVEKHGGVLLDGVGDAVVLHRHREALQGRAKEGRGGRSATMVYAYPFTLCRRAVVVTMDLSASNLDFFTQHHWLSDRRNVIVLHLRSPAWKEEKC